MRSTRQSCSAKRTMPTVPLRTMHALRCNSLSETDPSALSNVKKLLSRLHPLRLLSETPRLRRAAPLVRRLHSAALHNPLPLALHPHQSYLHLAQARAHRLPLAALAYNRQPPQHSVAQGSASLLLSAQTPLHSLRPSDSLRQAQMLLVRLLLRRLPLLRYNHPRQIQARLSLHLAPLRLRDPSPLPLEEVDHHSILRPASRR